MIAIKGIEMNPSFLQFLDHGTYWKADHTKRCSAPRVKSKIRHRLKPVLPRCPERPHSGNSESTVAAAPPPPDPLPSCPAAAPPTNPLIPSPSPAAEAYPMARPGPLRSARSKHRP